MYFILKLDTNTLVIQLNKVAINLPRALVTRQLVQIQLFNFKVKYIKGIKYTIANKLSRRPFQEGNTKEEEDIDNQIAIELNTIRIIPIRLEN